MYRFLRNIIFPFYHTVSDEVCPHIKNLYPVKSVRQFEKELDYFQKNFQSISLEEIINHVEENTQPERPSFFLSFDDGLRESSTFIAPILKRRNVYAAFFINTRFVDNRNLFYRYKISLIIEKIRKADLKTEISKDALLEMTTHQSDKIDEIAKDLFIDFDEFLQTEKPYMNWKEIEELSRQGFYIGGHSVDHPYYNQISFEEQIVQTRNSTDEVVSKLDLDYRIFSFPFTDLGVKKAFFETVYHERICDLTFGTAGMKSDEFVRNLQRIPMDNCLDSPEKFIQKEMISYHVKRLINKQKVIHPK